MAREEAGEGLGVGARQGSFGWGLLDELCEQLLGLQLL